MDFSVLKIWDIVKRKSKLEDEEGKEKVENDEELVQEVSVQDSLLPFLYHYESGMLQSWWLTSKVLFGDNEK